MKAMAWGGGETKAPGRGVAWALAYATVDQDLRALVAGLAQRYPGKPVFGATSSGGVFCSKGFVRGAQVLLGEDSDGVQAGSSTQACGAAGAWRASRDACAEIARQLGGPPTALLLHATPGFEERVLAGIEAVYEGNCPPVYGGSAADDDLKGNWRVFGSGRVEAEGFVLTGFRSTRKIHGSFVAGYLPTQQRGVVSRAQGRIVYEIDGRPAADVYNSWRNGALAGRMGGGVVLADTTLYPVGRLIDKIRGIPRYLLSHPHQILPDRSLSFFTDMATGDELVMMMGSTASLLDRTEQAVSRAMGLDRDGGPLSGGILIYCGGCVMALGERTSEVASLFDQQIKRAPFIGAATFGEVGCFAGPTAVNRHGNLMCDTLLFA